jgi:putative transcriptional regulator
MTGKVRNRRILDEVHETARGLRDAGVITKRRMHEYDALCHLEVPAMGAKRIRSIRRHANISQAVFAAVLNTSVSTVQKWEIGEKSPSGPSLKLLHVIERKGLEAVL